MVETEKICLTAGYVILIASLAGLFVFDTAIPLLAVPFILGVALIFYALYRYVGCRGGPDERLVRIMVYSMANSWLTTLCFATVYVVFDIVGILKEYTVMRTLCMTLFTMLLFFGTWYLYFQRKGDVE